MNTGFFRADIDSFCCFLSSPLLELPWKIVASPMKL
uniref:Uncharacterized protein n=1 Tax=Rhizophora mucronata TaxID=61149 RepID=A0A2P2IND1_RHIMU